MSIKKYIGLDSLSLFLTNLKNIFADKDAVLYKTQQELTVDEVNQVHQNLKLDCYATEEYADKTDLIEVNSFVQSLQIEMDENKIEDITSEEIQFLFNKNI